MNWLSREDQTCLSRRGYPGLELNEVVYQNVLNNHSR